MDNAVTCRCLAEPLKVPAGCSPHSWPADPDFRWHRVVKEANGHAAPKNNAEVRSCSWSTQRIRVVADAMQDLILVPYHAE